MQAKSRLEHRLFQQSFESPASLSGEHCKTAVVGGVKRYPPTDKKANHA